MFPATSQGHRSAAFDMTFPPSVAAFSGLGLTFRSTPAVILLPLFSAVIIRRGSGVSRLDFPVEQHQDKRRRCEHSDLCANYLASSHSKIPAAEGKKPDTGYILFSITKGVCSLLCTGDATQGNLLLHFPDFSLVNCISF